MFCTPEYRMECKRRQSWVCSESAFTHLNPDSNAKEKEEDPGFLTVRS
jgi:hypothetical protein